MVVRAQLFWWVPEERSRSAEPEPRASRPEEGGMTLTARAGASESRSGEHREPGHGMGRRLRVPAVDFVIQEPRVWSCGCCSVAKLCLTLCGPMNCSTPGVSVLRCLLELAQSQVH